MFTITREDVFGLLHPSVDVHNLGLTTFSRTLESCGFRTEIADEAVRRDIERLVSGVGGQVLRSWLSGKGVTALGFSYRLDPSDATRLFAALVDFLEREKLIAGRGGPLKALFFAGLPDACEAVAARYPWITGTFMGDESPQDSLRSLGVPEELLPPSLARGARYDNLRLEFGKKLTESGDYLRLKPPDRSGYPHFGQRGDRIEARIRHAQSRGQAPIMRAHAGPYLPDRKEAVKLFLEWTRRLAKTGYLDVLSIGTSQRTQSDFGRSWEGLGNGGGVPLATPEEFAEVWRASRPMLVRAYAGTRDVPDLAAMNEATIDIAWHALSFWWFCVLDGRGPNSVLANLVEHFDAMKFIAKTGKPLEPNVPHHFAFRGADDLSYVVSGYVAAKAAKLAGIKTLIVQTMLNTPKYTWGIQDLAKARALTTLVRSLESPDFRVYLQPRGGLDYFSPNLQKAKAQLAAVTALMDDIEPENPSSPQIIHVVSYSEASSLADPDVIDESIKITQAALDSYRAMKKSGSMPDMSKDPETLYRTEKLLSEVRILVDALERHIPDTYSPRGFYSMLAAGAFATPWLENRRSEFATASSMTTTVLDGSVVALDESGSVLSLGERIERMRRALVSPRGGFDAR